MSDRILVVDDTETMRSFYDVLLRGQGYQVEEAQDGVEAMEKVNAEAPALVLMDLMMPNMDGIEACRRIKSSERTRDVKVVMVTSRDEYSRITEAFAAGCDDYIVKPVDRTELMLKVKELLKFTHLRQLLRAGV
jgi:CheY-like chemotaxis protein